MLRTAVRTVITAGVVGAVAVGGVAIGQQLQQPEPQQRPASQIVDVATTGPQPVESGVTLKAKPEPKRVAPAQVQPPASTVGSTTTSNSATTQEQTVTTSEPTSEPTQPASDPSQPAADPAPAPSVPPTLPPGPPPEPPHNQ